MGDIIGSNADKVRAPNGTTYTLHRTGPGRGYVYAYGHRVYGAVVFTSVTNEAYGLTIEPAGKWAFTLAARTPTTQPSTVSV